MTDWDRYLPQVMGAYNSTQHSTTGFSPHLILTGHEKSLPLTFFYPEYEGKNTSPKHHSIKKQLVQKLTRWETTYGYFKMLYHPKKRKAPNKVEGTLHDYGSPPVGTFL